MPSHLSFVLFALLVCSTSAACATAIDSPAEEPAPTSASDPPSVDDDRLGPMFLGTNLAVK